MLYLIIQRYGGIKMNTYINDYANHCICNLDRNQIKPVILNLWIYQSRKNWYEFNSQPKEKRQMTHLERLNTLTNIHYPNNSCSFGLNSFT